jgi:hypothetical protein
MNGSYEVSMVSYLTYHILNKNVNKIDFVSPSADCSVVLWWGSLEGVIKTIIGTKTDFNTGSISMYEIVIKFYILNDSFKYNLLSFVIYDIVQYSVAS